jgi:hypothetical protein
VPRELGVSDIHVPKSMWGLTDSSPGLLLGATAKPLCRRHWRRSAVETDNTKLSSKALTSYLTVCVNSLERQPLATLQRELRE